MPRRWWILLGAGAAVVAAAAVARLALRAPAATATATPVPAPAPPGVTGPSGAKGAGGSVSTVPGEAEAPAAQTAADDEVGEGEDVAAPGVLGGFEKGRPLPVCGRTDEVELRRAPGGEPAGETLIPCAVAYADFPDLSRQVPVLAARDGWVQLPGGWAAIAEVRTVEVLVAGGREYWHGLFNADVAEVSGARVVLAGDADPCEAEHCGSGYAVEELAASLRTEWAQAHPGQEMPPEAQARIDEEVAKAQAAADEEDAAAEKAIRERTRVRRALELVDAPAGGAAGVTVDRPSYTCCT